MNRLWIFILVSLFFHAALFVSLSRLSLPVPETPGLGPVKVALVLAVESKNSERTGEREEEERGGVSGGQDQENNENPKEAVEPAKNRDKAERVLPKTKDDGAAILPDEKLLSKPLKPQKPEGLAESGKHREAERDGASEEKLEQGEKNKRENGEPLAHAPTAANHREISAEKDAQNGPGGRKTEPGSEKTGHTGRDNTEAGQSLQSLVPPLITDDLVVEKIMPVYPLIARRRGQEGRVLLRVTLSADGSVKNIMVEESSGFDALDRSALQAVNHWIFSRAAPKTVLVPVTFRLQ
ncbi:MAG: TonB family protein [Thermovirgaceae bacterium]